MSRVTAELDSTLSTLEAKPGVFLSPRVVDQGAFDEFAAQLRVLVRDTQAQHKILIAQQQALVTKLDAAAKAGTQLTQQTDRATAIERGVESKLTKAAEVAAVVNRDLANKLTELKSLASTDIAAVARSAREAAAAAIKQEVTTTIHAAISHAVAQAQLQITQHAQSERNQTLAMIEQVKLEVATIAADIKQTITLARHELSSLSQSAVKNISEQSEFSIQSLHTTSQQTLSECAAAERSVHEYGENAVARIIKATDDCSLATARATEVHQELTSANAGATVLAQSLVAGLEEDHERMASNITSLRSDITLLLEQVTTAAAALKEYTSEFDPDTLKQVCDDTADAVIKGTEVALTLRELTAVAAQSAQRSKEESQRAEHLFERAQTILPGLESLVKRSDVIGSALSNLLARAENAGTNVQ